MRKGETVAARRALPVTLINPDETPYSGSLVGPTIKLKPAGSTAWVATTSQVLTADTGGPAATFEVTVTAAEVPANGTYRYSVDVGTAVHFEGIFEVDDIENNQATILANQATILANQATLAASLATVLANQTTILANQTSAAAAVVAVQSSITVLSSDLADGVTSLEASDATIIAAVASATTTLGASDTAILAAVAGVADDVVAGIGGGIADDIVGAIFDVVMDSAAPTGAKTFGEQWKLMATEKLGDGRGMDGPVFAIDGLDGTTRLEGTVISGTRTFTARRGA